VELQETKHQLKLEQWRKTILECRSSGIAVRTWCRERQISIKTYYRWEKEVWASANKEIACRNSVQTAATDTAFAEISMAKGNSFACILTESPAITLHYCGCVLEIRNGTDSVLLQNTLSAIGKSC